MLFNQVCTSAERFREDDFPGLLWFQQILRDGVSYCVFGSCTVGTCGPLTFSVDPSLQLTCAVVNELYALAFG